MSGCEKHGGIHMRPWKEKEKYFFIMSYKNNLKKGDTAGRHGWRGNDDCINKNTPFCMKNIAY